MEGRLPLSHKESTSCGAKDDKPENGPKKRRLRHCEEALQHSPSRLLDTSPEYRHQEGRCNASGCSFLQLLLPFSGARNLLLLPKRDWIQLQQHACKLFFLYSPEEKSTPAPRNQWAGRYRWEVYAIEATEKDHWLSVLHRRGELVWRQWGGQESWGVHPAVLRATKEEKLAARTSVPDLTLTVYPLVSFYLFLSLSLSFYLSLYLSALAPFMK